MVRGIVAGLCLVLMMEALVEAQAVEVPALGGGGWKAVGKGASAGGVLTAVGSGADHTYWQSEPLGLKPATVYHLSFRARKRGSGGSPISGPVCCNRDLDGVSSQWKRFDSYFVTPTILRPEDCRLRFGQWQVKGEVDFDSVELHQAQAVYAHHEKMALGEGELIVGDEYTFAAPFQGESRNQSRVLYSFNCGFNSDRWVFGQGSEVVYRHRIEGRRQMSAEVGVSVTWYASGQLTVEASKDGKNWVALGTIGNRAGKTLRIPESLLPAEEIYVRMRSDARGSLQVGSYEYKAKTAGSPITLVGATRFWSVTHADPQIDVVIEDVGDALPGSQRNVISIRIDNRSGKPRDCQILTSTSALNSERWTPISVSGQSAAFDNHSQLRSVSLQPNKSVQQMPYVMLVPLEDGGFNSVHLIVGQFQAEATLAVPQLHASNYGESLRDGDVPVWWASSGWKISRQRPAPEKKGEAVQLSAARNEADAAQLVVRPGKALRQFNANCGELRGANGAKIPGGNVEILRERYLLITRPTDSTGSVGLWPDPLPALTSPIDLEADQNQPLWIRVRVPKDAPAGDYAGKIRLSAEGWSDEVAIRVHVYDFALPDRMTCQSAFGFSPGNVWRYQGLQKAEDRRAVLDKYFASFAAHHISPYDPAPLDPVKVTWADAKTNPRAVFDFSAWDKAMTRSMDQFHFNSFRLNIPGMGGGTFHARVEPELLGFRENVPQYKAAFASYCKQMEAHLREKGWLPYAYVYWFDEPDKKDYEFVSNGFRKLKEAAPGITRMLTEQPEPELFGGPNIWCAITPEYNHEKAEPRRKEGEKFWWYVCTGPKAPYCTLFIDHPGTELRVWLWQTWQRKIEGILVWETNYWTSGTAYPDRNRPQNPYEDPMSWTSGYGVASGTKAPWGNGDGRFIYPPESAANGNPGRPILDGPVDSIRWEMLRDGIEDYEYLAILRRLIDEKKLSGEERERYAKLLAVPAEITKDMTTFTKDPRAIEARREEVARAIEMLNRK